jgi:hypothetical protein
MFESPSRIILAIVGACIVLTVLVMFRSGDEKEQADAPRPGSLSSQLKPKSNSIRHDDTFGGGDYDRPRNLPPMDAARPALANGASGGAANNPATTGGEGSNGKKLDVASGGGRSLAAEPVPVAPPGNGVLTAGGQVAIDPEALATSLPGAPQDASLAVPFKGNGSSLGSMGPLFDDNVVYDADQPGAYFPPDARFAYGDAGTVQNNAGTIAFWIQPKWDGTDPRNASLVQYHTDDWSNRLQIFKNGIYLRYLFTDDTGNETNLSVNMAQEHWTAGEWHQIAITWGDSLIGMYIDGNEREQGTYMGSLDVPTGTALYVGSDSPGGNPGADATFQDFVVVDRALDPSEIQNMFVQGHGNS